MLPSERAKQFMPFAALKGLPEALAEKEKNPVPKKELTEEKIGQLNHQLEYLQKGQIVTIVYYHDMEYVQLTGIVTKINAYEKSLMLGEIIIQFEDLLDVII